MQARVKSAACKTMHFCRTYPLRACLIYIAAVMAFFIVFPSVDPAVTSIFYDGNGGFPVSKSYLGVKLRYLAVNLVIWAALACLALLIIKMVFPRLKAITDLRAPVFLLSTLILGPGVLVNMILKETWGRPRPRHTELFGGDQPFIGVWPPTNYCESNCSFVSGEGSSSFWLLALTLIVPARFRLPTFIATASLCLIFSANRVAFGGHFLSDTLLSWGCSALVIISVYHMLYVSPRSWAKPQVLENGIARAGIALQRKGKSAGSKLSKGWRSIINALKKV